MDKSLNVRLESYTNNAGRDVFVVVATDRTGREVKRFTSMDRSLVERYAREWRNKG